jgi:ASC-1-like (ASCH) protein
MTKQMKLLRQYAEKIVRGEKTVEVRLWSKRFSKLSTGNEICFSVDNIPLTAEVASFEKFNTLENMLSAITFSSLGFNSADEAKNTYRKIYWYNRSDERCWIAIHLKNPRWVNARDQLLLPLNS